MYSSTAALVSYLGAALTTILGHHHTWYLAPSGGTEVRLLAFVPSTTERHFSCSLSRSLLVLLPSDKYPYSVDGAVPMRIECPSVKSSRSLSPAIHCQPFPSVSLPRTFSIHVDPLFKVEVPFLGKWAIFLVCSVPKFAKNHILFFPHSGYHAPGSNTPTNTAVETG